MDLAEYVKIIMFIVLVIAVSSLFVKRNIITKIICYCSFATQIAVTFWALASGQIQILATWIFVGLFISGITILILYSDWNPFRRSHNHNTKNED